MHQGEKRALVVKQGGLLNRNPLRSTRIIDPRHGYEKETVSIHGISRAFSNVPALAVLDDLETNSA